MNCYFIYHHDLVDPGTPVSSTNKADHHDITEILLRVALNTINQAKQMVIRYEISIISQMTMDCIPFMYNIVFSSITDKTFTELGYMTNKANV